MTAMHDDVDQAGDGNPAKSRSTATGPAEPTRQRRRFLIIHNPVAGRNRINLAREVVRRLEQAGAVADLHCLGNGASDDSFLSQISAYDALVASGGDGTARSMVSLLQGTDIPFGLIPAGTGNVLAEELQLPRDAAGLAHMLLHGPVVGISTGAVNGAPLLLMLGAGFDGQVVARLPIGLKRRIGKPAFGWPIMTALAQEPHLFSVTIDGKVREASWLIVANAARYGGHFLLSERTNALTPGFNVVISRARSRIQRLVELLHLVAGKLEKAKSIEMLPAREIEILNAEGLPVQIDGETIASPSYRIVADVSRTPVIVPARTHPTQAD